MTLQAYSNKVIHHHATLVKLVRVSDLCGSSNDTDFSMTGALLGGDFITGASTDIVDYMNRLNT